MAQGYQVEEVPDNVVPLQPQPSFADKAMVTGVMLGLKALSQGSAIALSNIASHVFSLITVAMVFWVWVSVPDPNQLQIVSLSLFAVFILVINWIVKRK